MRSGSKVCLSIPSKPLISILLIAESLAPCYLHSYPVFTSYYMNIDKFYQASNTLNFDIDILGVSRLKQVKLYRDRSRGGSVNCSPAPHYQFDESKLFQLHRKFLLNDEILDTVYLASTVVQLCSIECPLCDREVVDLIQG